MSAIIGGLRSESSGTTTRSVPVLGSLPWIGQAFRTDAVAKISSELVVSVTAQLIR